MPMLTLLAEQTGVSLNPSQLKDFLQYGQMGLALATLVLGVTLFMTAIKKPDLSKTTADILRFFGKVMVTLFVVSFLGEMATKAMDFYMEFYMKEHPVDPQVNVTIAMPPLNTRNHKVYGAIEIQELEAGKPPSTVPANAPQQFVIHNGAQFHIDLDNLISLLDRIQLQSNIARNETTKSDQTAGAGQAK